MPAIAVTMKRVSAQSEPLTSIQLRKVLFGGCRKFGRSLLLVGFTATGVLAAPDTALLDAIKEPIILKGDSHTAYRDPLLIYHDQKFYLYSSYVKEDPDHRIYWYVALSTSPDLQHWSESRILTPKDQNLNYSSPGSIVRVGADWIMCLQTYPIAPFKRGDQLRWGDNRCRLFTMRSRDLQTWSAPELLMVKGPDVSREAMPHLIDPFLLLDKDVPDQWWCFYKENGQIHASKSLDLKTWFPTESFVDHQENQENPCILVDHGEYVLFYSPKNGIGVRRSTDLVHWQEDGPPITLGQRYWPWAETRLTAGYVEDLRQIPGVGRYVMVCHSMGPGKVKTDANVNANCSVVIAWSSDLKIWHWPGEK